MPQYGMIMDTDYDATRLDDKSKQLCKDLLSGNNQIPTDCLFQDDHFNSVVRAAEHRSEAKFFRDTMPLLVPSAELLHIRGGEDESKEVLKDIREEVNADWVWSGALYGPCPRPDFAVGLKISAFTGQEAHQIESWSTASHPGRVTDHMYFPFLVCDVKCANGHLVQAERQSMHSASIAVKAIIGLYPEESRKKQACGKILAFLVVFDHNFIRLFGHYALSSGDRLRFCRYSIASFSYSHPSGRDRWVAYNFVRRVYTKFVPVHVERIRRALSSLASRSPESSYEVEVDNDREMPESQANFSWKQSALDNSQMTGMHEELRKRDEDLRKRDEEHRELRKQLAARPASMVQHEGDGGDGGQ